MSRKNNRKTRKMHKQKLFLMHGCSKNNSRKHKNVVRSVVGGTGCGSSGCPIPPFSWAKMNAVGGKNVMQGGPILGVGATGGSSFYKLPDPIPGPFVGQSWGAPLDKWPGVDGVSSNHNWLAYNKYIPDISRQMKLGGSRKGKSYKKHHCNKSYKKGGGFSLIPQDLVNLGRDVSFNFKSAYNSLNGYKVPVDPLPYKDQLTKSFATNRIIV
jgi:hypothetical protein